MVEYAKCIYQEWSSKHTLDYCQQHEHEFLHLCSCLLKYTPEELHNRLINEYWYLQ